VFESYSQLGIKTLSFSSNMIFLYYDLMLKFEKIWFPSLNNDPYIENVLVRN